MRIIALAFGATLSAAVAMGCAQLPEPESAAAKLYTERCSGCHRLYVPSLYKFEMWRYQVGRMQTDLQRGGLPPLTSDERAMLLDYLKRHSG